MKLSDFVRKIFPSLLLTSSFVIISSIINSGQAAAEEGFFYKNNSVGIPTTYARTKNGDREFIQWRTAIFKDYPPENRAKIVTNRLNEALVPGKTVLLTTGFWNKLPVICTAKVTNGPCDKLIYTLQPGDSGVQTLQELIALNQSVFLNPPRKEKRQIWINLNKYLENPSSKFVTAK
jgi:hypothetical protein